MTNWNKEYQMMITIVVCAIMGVICAVIAGQLWTQGPLADYFSQTTAFTELDLQTLIFFLWLLGGIALGVYKH